MNLPRATIEPIYKKDLDRVCRFLHEHMNSHYSPAEWMQSLSQNWYTGQPNFGVQLRTEHDIVGVFCALYSLQMIGEQEYKVCNPHSWCVLSNYRQLGIGLLFFLLKQDGFEFVMLTPSARVAKIFRGLRFRDLDNRMTICPCMPWPGDQLRGARAVSDVRSIAKYLSGSALRDFDAHKEIPWLRFMALGDLDGMCLVVYKTQRWKRVRCAKIIYISSPETFDRCLGSFRSELLLRHSVVVFQVESRFLHRVPKFAFRGVRRQPKLLLSSSLRDGQVSDLYSELVALDL